MKMFVCLLASVLLFLCASCTDNNGSTAKIGVSMPTKEVQRWNEDGDYLRANLEKDGYNVLLQYANNDIAVQVSQIEAMINAGCKALIIAPIDGKSLGTVLELAKEKAIPVIAYDRLLMNSDAVSYYVTFDNYKVGTIQGEFLARKLDLQNASQKFNIEIFAGDSADNNSQYFYNGAMDILNPYIESGVLNVCSGQTSFQVTATANWSAEQAQNRCDAILSRYYAKGEQLDAVLSPNDLLAMGIMNSLDANYRGSYPVITGQDADIAGVRKIIEGKQAMTVFKDTRKLADTTVKNLQLILQGAQPEVNDTTTYDNGVITVPSYLCSPVIVDKSNYKELLIDSGYYTEAQLQ